MSDQVRQAIRDSGMSQYAIAKASGVTKATLSRFMAGKRDMTLRLLDRIASLIGVSLKVEKPKRRTKGK